MKRRGVMARTDDWTRLISFPLSSRGLPPLSAAVRQVLARRASHRTPLWRAELLSWREGLCYWHENKAINGVAGAHSIYVSAKQAGLFLRPHGLVIFVHPFAIRRTRSCPPLNAVYQHQALHTTVALIREVVGKPTGGTRASAARRTCNPRTG